MAIRKIVSTQENVSFFIELVLFLDGNAEDGEDQADKNHGAKA
jgi:hypothetical protein